MSAAAATVPAASPPATVARWSAIALASLCVDGGVHLGLAAMHGATGLGAAFAAAGAAPVLAVVALAAGWRRVASVLAPLALAGPALVYAVSRVVALPLVGRGDVDVLGALTLLVELVGLAAAAHLSTRQLARATTPLALCALIVVYSAMAAAALPSEHSDHSHQHHAGHQHVAPR